MAQRATRKSYPEGVKAVDTWDLKRGRECRGCGQYKDREHFYAHPQGLNGLSGKCKECAKTYSKQPKYKKRKKELYVERREAGVCVNCAGPPVQPGACRCRTCWFGDMSANRTGTTKNAKMLEELWDEQGGCCFYTGEALVEGATASVDHQLPVSRGGTHERENLKWVTKKVNVAKGTLTHEEFVALCALITQQHPK